MTAYVFAEIDVSDLDAYLIYAKQTPEIAAKFNGKFLVKAGDFEQLEGSGRARHVLIKFPDMHSARKFYNSDDYQAILPVALKNSIRDMVLVEGAE